MAVKDKTIVTLDEMRAFLGIPSEQTAKDSLIESLLDSFNKVIEDWLGVTMINSQYAEIYDGDGTDTLFLEHYPIVAISSLKLDGEALDSDDYYIYPYKGYIRLADSVFTKDYQNIEITYTAGWGVTRDDIPDALKLALKMWVERTFKGENVDFSQRFGESFIIRASMQSIPVDIKQILSPYKVYQYGRR